MQQPTAPPFDKTLLQPVRLATVTTLVACGGEAPFAEVRVAAGSPSNSLLWQHTVVLEEANYIEVRKAVIGRQVKTSLVLTDVGRRAFDKHMEALTAASSSATVEASI